MRSDTHMKRFSLRLAAVCGLAASIAIANPGEGDVDETWGDVQFVWEDGYLTIVASDGSIIDWFNFNIGEGETVEFILPGMDARILNRILSGVPTEIMGNLLSNGQVYIVNPSGVIFGNGAVVNVGALYAAAGNISNDDFVAGVNRFTDARGVVENRGLLQGDLIALIGGRVANHGTISAPMGTVIMASGEEVLIGEHLGNIFVQLIKPSDLDQTDQLSGDGLDLAAGDIYSLAAWNTGTIDGGNVQMHAGSGTMLVSGSIDAHMGTMGGDVLLDGQDVRLSGATINASGDLGGSLAVYGDSITIDRGVDPARGGSISAGTIELVSTGSPINLGADLTATDGSVTIDGDTVLTDSVAIQSFGDDAGIEMLGSIASQSGMFNSLTLSAADGTVSLAGPIGSMGGDDRLGMLEVNAGLARVGGDVFVRDGMDWFTPVAVYGDSVTFHTGDGSALFADDIYSEVIGASDVAFLYDGEAYTGNGEARTPFKFRGNIGIGNAVSPFITIGGAFGNIRFGDDISTPSSASGFLFSTGAMSGMDLMNGSAVDLGTLFRISAIESVVMGRGQKMLTMGSLSLSAKGPGTTLVELGDMNILGDLLVTSLGFQGGEIHLLGRIGSLVDSQDSEGDRENGIIDGGAEMIVMGSITLLGDVSTDGGSYRIANNSGLGDAGGLDIEVYPGGVSLDPFYSILRGDKGGGFLYPYDLYLLPDSPAPPTDVLAESFVDEGPLTVRDDPALVAGMEILRELGMNPRDPSDRTLHEEQSAGGANFDEVGAAGFGVTIDRLSPRSVQRLADAYVGLLGEHPADATEPRVELERVKNKLGWLWLQCEAAGASNAFVYAAESDPEGYAMLFDVHSVLDAIDRLELTPLEIARAKANFVAMLRPQQIPADRFNQRWLGIEPIRTLAER
ncbi:MAG: filamentous hemagglutinin N-terminal domain-containing protein [Phycisphaerales bacterium]|nr:filamentous hemagglutinin N-terminal domain-containing protein [Phycisphaerales bacterium]